MTSWLPDLAGRSGPLYLQIVEAIGEAVAAGRLAARDRLPTQRDLAHALGLSLNTVTRAYAEATRRGFLDGAVGRGTFVRATGPLPAQGGRADMTRPGDGPIDLSLNLPAAGEAPALLADSLAALSRSNALPSCLDYQVSADLERHSEAAAAWLDRIGLAVAGADLVLTNGAQHGLLVALLATARPGDVLLAEALTYAPIKALARHLGLRIVPVALDGGGLCPEALERACRETAAGLLYCLPTLQTPTGVTMDPERRRAIAEVARRHALTVIEDDVFGFLPQERPAPLACDAPERTLFVTSVSKSLAPGLRVGLLAGPARLRPALRAAVNLSCWMTPPLMAEIACRWIADGTAERLNAFQRSEAAARRRIALDILGGLAAETEPSGFHLWLALPPPWSAGALRAAAERRGVKLLTAETFAVEPTAAPQAIRLCLSHEISRARVAEGLEIVADLLNGPPDAGALVV